MKEGFSALVADDDDFSRRTAVGLLRRLAVTALIIKPDRIIRRISELLE